MNTCYIGLGSNIEPCKQYLDDAIEMLGEKEVVISKMSSIYETAPVGYTEQSNFLNMVIEVRTELEMIELLDVCQKIEVELGRKRTFKNGPRTVDLDILFYNDENVQIDRLIIPHPRLHERAFVLVPLAEIAPELIMPNQTTQIIDLLAGLTEAERGEVILWEKMK